jgi:DNA-binding GntR family transcriptional regulator
LPARGAHKDAGSALGAGGNVSSISASLEAPPGASSASPDLNRQIAYRRFQQQLLSGQMQPGQNLSQRELVGQLGISLGALRELLPRLEAEGLLRVLPQRGIQIMSVDLRMIRESYQMRLAFEREATIFAVDNVADAPLRKQHRLHAEIIERAKAGITGPLLDEAQRIDSGFHDFLIGSTGNGALIQAYSIVAIRVRMIQLDRIRLNAVVLTPSLGDHLEIIDGVLARDRTRAVAAMEAHIRKARERAVAL